jgi:sterol desaturase/sphingolipid hydroxylase (fatty acid hydroxylase superfamily)
MTGPQIIVLATPVFWLLIAIEWVVGRRRGRDTYRLHDTLASIGLGITSQLLNFLTRVIGLGIYVAAFQHLALWKLPADSVWVWLSALFFYDFLYYWFHRGGHRIALMWAAHAVHHQSEDYNLSTALRQTGTGWICSWVFFLPMALAGYPPFVYGTIAIIDLLYQYWVHTQQIGKLGWFDRWFCSPSNHRVHHAVNDEYLDKNYGGIFIFWDRLFGTFAPERDAMPCVYGTRSPLQSWSPLRANLQVYREIALDTWRAERWGDKVKLWLKPPGWRPPDLQKRFPKPAFDLAHAGYYDPQTSPVAKATAVFLFAGTMLGVAWVLWHAHEIGYAALILATVAAFLLLGLVGRLGSGTAQYVRS